jgi:protein-S-isoprenylcysteine O-methyltransferase Ste14
LAQPSFASLAVGGSVAALGLVVRALSAGHLEKNRRLATTGPYAHSRNPLYLGSFLMGTGFALAGGSLILAGAFVVFFLAVYLPVMRAESDSLHSKFGESYSRYEARVPLFFPAWPAWRRTEAGTQRFSWSLYRQNREYEAALGYFAGLGLLALKVLLHRGR